MLYMIRLFCIVVKVTAILGFDTTSLPPAFFFLLITGLQMFSCVERVESIKR